MQNFLIIFQLSRFWYFTQLVLAFKVHPWRPFFLMYQQRYLLLGRCSSAQPPPRKHSIQSGTFSCKLSILVRHYFWFCTTLTVRRKQKEQSGSPLLAFVCLNVRTCTFLFLERFYGVYTELSWIYIDKRWRSQLDLKWLQKYIFMREQTVIN